MTNVPPPHQPQPHQQPVMPVTGPQAAFLQPPAGHGALVLTLQGNAMTAGLTPSVHIDGYPVPGGFGPNFYPLRPGRHRVDVHTQWLRQYGQASMDLDIREGQTVPGYYAVPWHQFTTGSIGHVKQTRKGLGVVLALLALVTVLVLGCALGAALLG
ncbi:hypothetical protein N5P18_11095 [Janibacter terrae]|uniref:Uncharacterized protein n=1 Tax=Janibacter terrae TaxID=103817 RepID=A0ABZ2FAB0_9MICO|nr:hypothetical protein [Janibacter terrae]